MNGRHILRMMDDVKEDEGWPGRGAIAAPLSVASKAPVSTEKNEMRVTDHSRPYLDSRCCYWIEILLTEPLYSNEVKTQHNNSRPLVYVNMASGCLV